MSAFYRAMETAANYCLFASGDHMRCRAAYLDGFPQDACAECKAECACCGEAIAIMGGRDESITGVVLCQYCGTSCQGCRKAISDEFFTAGVEQYGDTTQIVPLCKVCSVRNWADELEAA